MSIYQAYSKHMVSEVFDCRRFTSICRKYQDLDNSYQIAKALKASFCNPSAGERPDIRYIQELPGHNSPKTTMIYAHVSNKHLGNIVSPFDDLEV